MNAIILCGGLSTRLGSLTKDRPKILLEVGPKRVLDWQIEKIKSLGVKQVVLAAGHLANILRDEVGTHCSGVELIYAIEDKKLGTGGAVKHALEYIDKPEEPFFVLNGDVLVAVDFSDMAACLKQESEGIILGIKVEDTSPYGALVYDSDFHLKRFSEKEGKGESGYINGGVYLFTGKAIEYFPEKDEFSTEYDVFPFMKNLYVYESDQPWIDVGVPERLEWARRHWEKFTVREL